MPLFVDKSGCDGTKKSKCRNPVWLICNIFHFNYIYNPVNSLENKVRADFI